MPNLSKLLISIAFVLAINTCEAMPGNSIHQELMGFRCIPDNITQIITELPKILNDENYQEAYKIVYLSLINNEK